MKILKKGCEINKSFEEYVKDCERKGHRPVDRAIWEAFISDYSTLNKYRKEDNVKGESK